MFYKYMLYIYMYVFSYQRREFYLSNLFEQSISLYIFLPKGSKNKMRITKVEYIIWFSTREI